MRTIVRGLLSGFVYCLLMGAGVASDLGVVAVPEGTPYTIGEPMSVRLEVTNSSRSIGWLILSDGNVSRSQSGLLFNVTHIESGRVAAPTKMPPWPQCSLEVPPNGVATAQYDIAELFVIHEPGRYRFQVRYVEYMTLVSDDLQSWTTQKLVERVAPDVEFVVKSVDKAVLGRLEKLLRSEVDADVLEGLSSLATERVAVYRAELPVLWSVVRSQKGVVKNQAFKVFLSRLELIDDRITDEELFAEMTLASSSPDVSLRLATAEAISRMKVVFRTPDRWGALFDFISRRVPKWFESETSPACRALLLRRLPLSKRDELITIVQQDKDPQVRFAAIQRLIGLDPQRFLDSAESFTNLAGEATVEGKSVSLGSFVATERERVRRLLHKDEEGDSAHTTR